MKEKVGDIGLEVCLSPFIIFGAFCSTFVLYYIYSIIDSGSDMHSFEHHDFPRHFDRGHSVDADQTDLKGAVEIGSSLFVFLLGGTFHFYSNFNRTFS